MPVSKPALSQVLSGLHPQAFSRCVERFPMQRASRSFSAYDHFLALCFGQLTYRESLRDIVACLNSRPHVLYHLGFRGRITRTNVAYANEHRDWRLFAAVAEVLIRRAQQLYQEDLSDPDLPQVAFALDSSIIHLSLKLFPWAYWARSCATGLKLHTMVSLRGNIPTWSAITEASFPDMKMLDHIPVQPGAFYIMDRGYLDFTRLIRLHECGARFVVRNKANVRFYVVDACPVDKRTGLRCNQTIRLKSSWSKHVYRWPLRRIHFRDEQESRSLVFLTNDFDLPAAVICELYRRRWQVELFFKWIKQHLRIRNFFGRSCNAIHCQIWTAICTYLLVAIAKKQIQSPKSLYQILQILSVSAFEQLPLSELLGKTSPSQNPAETQNTPCLLGF
ncbi:MAG: IS4 family transposase [Limisphaerales bacterium]